jgi:predicted phosphate transport protein (TIGR00153 family)
MSLLFGKKENEVLDLFFKHLLKVKKTIDTTYTLLGASNEEINNIAKKVRNLETEADSIRRDAETMMYAGAFLAQSRGDMLGLIEAIDKISNKAEFISDLIYLQNLEIPSELIEDYKKEFEISKKTYEALQSACKTLFDDIDKTKELVLEVEKWENQGDHVERDLVKKIFSMDIDLAWKMQLRELAFQVGDIADRSEDASDRIEIILLKTSA